jgi:hypothetical protein
MFSDRRILPGVVAALLVIGCDRSGPLPASKAILERSEAGAAVTKPKSLPWPPTGDRETVDLSDYGIPAKLDVPPGTEVKREFRGVTVSYGHRRLLMIDPESGILPELSVHKAELAKKNVAGVRTQVLEDEPDGLVVNVDSELSDLYLLRRDVVIGGRPYYLSSIIHLDVKGRVSRDEYTPVWQILKSVREVPAKGK